MNLVADSYSFYTFSSLPGIVIAAVLYPPIAICLYMVACAFGLAGQMAFDEMLGVVLVAAFTMSYIGFFIGFLSGLLAIGLISLFNWSIGYQFSAPTATSVAGGLAGFIPTSVVLWNPSILFSSNPVSQIIVLIAIGPVLATVCGQTGARIWEKKLVRKSLIQPPHTGWIRFGIRNMIALTLWCSLLLVVSRWLGLMFLGIVLTWCVGQSILLGMVILINRLVWRNNRRSEIEDRPASTVQHGS